MDIATGSSASSRLAADPRPDESMRAVGADELREGLMLVHAGTIDVVRLQLAIERHDRRVALEAVDDLVALDDRLQRLLGRLPATHGATLLERDLDRRRAALAREKLTLAAGMSGPAAGASPTAWLDEAETPPVEAREPEAASGESLRISFAARVGVLLALLLLATAGAFLVLGPSGIEAMLAGIGDRSKTVLGEGRPLR